MNQQNNNLEKNNANSVFDDEIIEFELIEKPEKSISKPTKKVKKRKTKKILLWILIVILVLLLSGVLTVVLLIQSGKNSLLNTDNMVIKPNSSVTQVEIDDDGKTVEFEGKKYTYNENMTAILCIGVDKENFFNSSEVMGKNGQADALFLFAMDTSTGKSTIIPIPRDSMVDVDIYSSQGGYISSDKKQLCLSYAYGDGKHTSCENTIKSVSRLLYGLQINSYVAIDLKAIEVLSKKVGGVPVIPTENFSYSGYNFYKGKEVTLKGINARMFVQGRDINKLDSSLERMSRQKLFVSSFFNKSIEKTKQNITFPIDVYNSTSKYFVTNLGVSEISFLASCVLKNDLGLEYKSIEGSIKKGEKYAEYYLNDQSAYKTVIDVFYNLAS